MQSSSHVEKRGGIGALEGFKPPHPRLIRVSALSQTSGSKACQAVAQLSVT